MNLPQLTAVTGCLFAVYLASSAILGWKPTEGVIEACRHPGALAGLIALVAAGVLLRFVRWLLYSRRLRWPVTVGRSLVLFITGFAFSATPGKAGEIVKCALLRDSYGVPIAESGIVLLLERLGDLLAVSMLALGALFAIPKTPPFAAAGLAAAAAALALILIVGARPQPPYEAHRPGRLASLAVKAAGLLETCRALLTPRLCLGATALALAAWGCEALGFAVLANALLPQGMPVAQAISIFGLATLAGAFSFLPGGLGGFEAAMALLLSQTGASPAEIVSVITVFRLCTLWLATIVGIACLALWTAERAWEDRLAMGRRSEGRIAPVTKFTGATVILPVMTETHSLRQTVDIILRDCSDDIERFLIVVGERTRPESLAVAFELQQCHGKLVHVHFQARPFLGGAIQDGFDLVESSHAVMMASDLETDPNDVQALIRASRANPSAIVTASRWMSGAGFYGYGPAKRWANLLFQRFFGVLYRTQLSDLTYGYRLFPTRLVQSIAWQELRHAFLLETLVRPLRMGAPVVEIPSVWRSRIEGESQNRFRNHWEYFRIGLKVRFGPRWAAPKQRASCFPAISTAASPEMRP